MPMKPLLAGLLLLLAAAPCFGAEYTITVKGQLVGNTGGKRNGLPNVSLKASPDPLWGQKSLKDLERIAAVNKQQYPQITVTGSGTSDATGNFEFQVKVEVPEGKSLPRSSDGGNPPTWNEYVCILLEGEVPGFRSIRYQLHRYASKESYPQTIFVERIARVTGRLMNLSTMTPLAAKTLVIRPKMLFVPDGHEVPAWKVTTDSKGNFDFNDPTGPVGEIEIRMEDESLTFATNSKAWTSLLVQSGDNDLGNLMVVPGCSLKLRVIESANKQPVSVYIELVSKDGGLRLSEASPKGSFERTGLPVGNYELNIVTGAYWGKRLSDLSLKAGENDLGDIEVDPVTSLKVEVDVDQGQLPAGVIVHCFLLEGAAPQGAPKFNDNYGVQISLQGRQGFLSHLYQGRWYVMAKARGWAPSWRYLNVPEDLPADGILRFTLSQGGSFELNVLTVEGSGDSINNGAVAAVGTPAETWLRTSRQEERPAFKDELGLMYEDADGQTWKPGPLMPGKYYVRASTNGGMVRAEFEVKAGQHTKLTLTPPLPRVEVLVTKDGKPAPGQKVLAIMGSVRNDAEEVVQASSDSKGLCVFDLKRAEPVTVVLQHEKDWLDAATTPAQRRERMKAFYDRTFYLWRGNVVSLSIDVGGRDSTWLTVDVTLGKGWRVSSSQLSSRLPGTNSARLTVAGTSTTSNKLEFAMLRPGHYWLTIGLIDESLKTYSFQTAVHALPKPEQTIKVKAVLHSVEVSVALPKGATENEVLVALFCKRQWLSDPGLVANSTELTRGKFTVRGVPPGEYYVMATYTNKNGQSLHGSTLVNVTGNAKAKVTISENQADLHLNLEGTQQGSLPQGMEATVRATLWDKAGKEVSIGYPISATGSLGSLRVQGVPVGTYTLRVEATSFRTWQGEVTIQKGEPLQLSVRLAPAPVVRLTLDRQLLSAVQAQDFTMKLENAAGVTLPITEKDFDKLFCDASRRSEAVLLILGLDASATRMRLKFRGYKEAIVALNLPDGGMQSLTLNLVPE